jgi:hypothetical protein
MPGRPIAVEVSDRRVGLAVRMSGVKGKDRGQRSEQENMHDDDD